MKKGLQIVFTMLLGFAAIGAGGFMLYLFFTLSWMPTALAWVLRIICAIFILSALVIMVKQLKEFSK